MKRLIIRFALASRSRVEILEERARGRVGRGRTKRSAGRQGPRGSRGPLGASKPLSRMGSMSKGKNGSRGIVVRGIGVRRDPWRCVLETSVFSRWRNSCVRISLVVRVSSGRALVMSMCIVMWGCRTKVCTNVPCGGVGLHSMISRRARRDHIRGHWLAGMWWRIRGSLRPSVRRLLVAAPPKIRSGPQKTAVGPSARAPMRQSFATRLSIATATANF